MNILKKIFEALFVAGIIICGLWLRILILNIPLNVDEGYWAYIATLLLKGQKLFADIWSTNPLFIYIPYILSESILGHGLSNLRLLGVFTNILTVGVIFFLAKKAFGKWVGFVSLLFASIFALAFQQEGHFILNAEHLGQLPLFLSLLFMVYAFEAKDKLRSLLFALSGFLMGYVWQVREHYFILHTFIFLYLLYGFVRKKIGRKDMIYYFFGSITPVLIIIVYLLINGNLVDYLRSVYYYRYLYMQSAQSVVFDSSFFNIVNDRMGHLLWILVFTIIGLTSLAREKERYKNFWAVIVFISSLLILLSTGNRLFNHYFLYLTYGSIVLGAYGFVAFIKYLKRNFPILIIPVVVLVGIFSFRQFYLNQQYLLQFNQPKSGLPYKNLIVNKEMLAYLNQEKPGIRILFLGESIPNYYYFNQDMKEKYPGPGFFIYEPYRTLIWKFWFDNFKKNSSQLIIEDFGIEDLLVISEFKDYVNGNYVFDRRINQHYIFRYKGV